MKREVLPDASRCSQNLSPHSVEFSELVRLHWRLVFQTCLSITRNQHDAEDAAQDCFLSAFCHLDQFQGKAQISTWLCTIARNCSLGLLRKKKRRPEVTTKDSPDFNGKPALFDPQDNRPDQLSCFLHAENLGLLVKSIAALPATLRTTADLVILNERTLREVGEILEVSNGAVKTRLSRARDRLRGSSAIKAQLR